ncbi:MAG: glycosyltransferase family 39 protein [Candidatus Dormibacteraceae bacterium]
MPIYTWLRRLALGRPGDPRWARPALWAILVLAAVLYTWALSSNGNANTYYAAAVLSGTKSWKAFFYGALDAQSYITVDKPPLALWVMGLSARLFGFNSWSLLLPQALEGVAAVAVLYTVVRRGFGYGAAVIAALVLALTPVTVAINRYDNPDALLALLLVLAGGACLWAIRSGRWLPLLLAALCVGLAFNTKTLEAYLVLPAFALVYLVAAPGSIQRRLVRLLGTAAVLAVVSFAWVGVVDAVPAADRPYVGGSANNSETNLIFGYNGVGRITGNERPDNEAGNPFGGGRELAGAHHFGGGMGGQKGITRLFGDSFGGQISWLLPFALIAGVGALVLRGRRPRIDTQRAELLLWGIWLATDFVVFSYSSGIIHAYYTTAMAPALAALVGAGGVALLGAYRRSRRWMWILPLALVVTGVWAVVLLLRTPGFLPWLPWAVAVLFGGAALVLILARLGGGGRVRARIGAAAAAAAAGLVASLAAPAAYAVTTVTRPNSGATAGPATANPFGGGDGGRNPTAGGHRAGGFGQTKADPQLVRYLQVHQDGASWLVAVPNAMAAAPIILTTGEPVMAIGGFSGSDQALSTIQLAQYVQMGKLHYLLLGGSGRGGGNAAVTGWVEDNCSVVRPGQYGQHAGRGASSPFAGGSQQLYHCD